MTTPNSEDFIAEWLDTNPKGCRGLAAAVIYAYFTEASEETDQRVLSLNCTPDGGDLNDVLIDAIRCTDLIDRLEDVLGTRSHCW